MRGTEHFRRHLFIETERDYQRINKEPVEDPFHTTTVTLSFGFWELLKMFLGYQSRQTQVRVKVRADNVAMGRWFQGEDICERCKISILSENVIDSSGELWCETCRYNYPILSKIDAL